MRLDTISSAPLQRSNAAARSQAEPDSATSSNESRALVVLSPAAEPSERQAERRHAPFVAQLLAVKDQHPQTRERRRAEPREVLDAYRATVALTDF